MRPRIGASFVLGLLLAWPAACVTVNIYFPAPEVRAAAEEIVDETWGDAAAPQGGVAAPEQAPSAVPETPPSGMPPSPESWLQRLAPASAWAGEGDPNIDVTTAPIRALRAQMRDRAGQLKPYLSAGNVGIGRDGMLVVRDLDGVALSDQAKIRRLVDAENRDRKALYAEIAEANGFGRERIGDIQKIFAETWIQKAERGWSVQGADGEWTKK